MKVSTLTKSQWIKVAKALLYVGLSSVIAAAIAMLQEQPEMFGVYTPIVNVLLVTIKQAFSEGK